MVHYTCKLKKHKETYKKHKKSVPFSSSHIWYYIHLQKISNQITFWIVKPKCSEDLVARIVRLQLIIWSDEFETLLSWNTGKINSSSQFFASFSAIEILFSLYLFGILYRISVFKRNNNYCHIHSFIRTDGLNISFRDVQRNLKFR